MICLTDFAIGRHFSADFAGTKIASCGSAEFESEIANLLPESFVPGYAPFCKHVFVRNTWEALAGVVEITPENEHLLRTEYVSRRVTELPVLTRYFPRGSVQPEVSAYLDLILYSAEQLKSEGVEISGEWGIVSINSCTEPCESPIGPTTMLRNALGKEQGGSGVELDEAAYLTSVHYWTRWATVK
jgi:hypothetical protein